MYYTQGIKNGSWKQKIRSLSLFVSLVLLWNLFNFQIFETQETLADANNYISGTVLHGSDPIVGMELSAYSNKCGVGFLETTQTTSTGAYVFQNLNDGDAYIKTQGTGEMWWNNVTDCNNATAVSVSSGAIATGIDFNYAQGGNISGNVKNSSGANVANMVVKAYSGKCESGYYNRQIRTDSNGNYTITGLPVGSVYVKVCPTCVVWLDNPDDWWNGTGGTGDCNGANAVTITAGTTTANIDFTLKSSGSVSGTITSSGSAVNGLNIFAYDSACGGNLLASDETDASGNYQITDLSPGNIYIKTNAYDYKDPYMDKWWNSSGGSADCNQAEAVAITTWTDNANKNLDLIATGTVTGRIMANWNPLEKIYVSIYNSEICGSGSFIDGGYSDINGDYSINTAPPWKIMLRTSSSWSYVSTWWNSSGGTDSCSWSEIINMTSSWIVANLNFDLTPDDGGISGTVTHNSIPVPQQSVNLYESDCSTYIKNVFTDNNGQYTLNNLSPGEYRLLTASSSGTYLQEWYDNANQCSSGATVTVNSAITTTNINFDIALTPWNITGKLTSNSSPLPNYVVYLYDSNCDYAGINRATDSNGNYAFNGLTPGTYHIQAYSSDDNYVNEFYNNAWTCQASTSLTVTTGETLSNIDFDINAKSISGKLTNNGDSLAGYGVYIYPSTCWSTTVASTTTNASGNYTFYNLAPATYHVRAYSWAWLYVNEYYNNASSCPVSNNVVVSAGINTKNIDIDLARTPTIKGRATYNGNPVSGQLIYLYNSSYAYAGRNVSTNSNGDYIFYNLTAGTYYVRAYSSVSGWPYNNVYYNNVVSCENGVPLTVGIGNTASNIDFALTPRPGNITGTISSNSSSIANQTVQLYQTDCSTFVTETNTNASGQYSLDSLTPGNYRLRTSSSSGTYVTEWYDNVSTCAGANNVTVGTGATTANINFDLADTVAPNDVSSETGSSTISSVNLTWTNPTESDFQGIIVLQSTGNITTSPTTGTTYNVSDNIDSAQVIYSGNGTNFNSTNLNSNTDYFFKIFTYDVFKNYSAGTTLNLTTKDFDPDTTKPTAPQIITPVLATNSQVQLTWLDSSDPTNSASETVSGLKGYKIYRDSTEIKITNGTGTAFTDTGVTAGTTYAYQVFAYDNANNTSTGSTVINVTTSLNADTTKPTAPQIITPVLATNSQVQLTWLDSSDPTNSANETVSGLKGYKIYRDSTEIKITNGTGTAFTDTGVTAGTTYAYQLFAYDNANNTSTGSTVINVTTALNADTTKPTAPTLSNTVESSSSVKLTWTASSDPTSSTGETVSGLAGYKIYRNGTEIKNLSGVWTTFTDTGLSASTTYNYEVLAYDVSGNESTKSNSSSATTLTQSNNSSSSSSSSGGGGGGWGGGGGKSGGSKKLPAYTLASTESTSTALLKNRGVDLEQIQETLPRPLKMINESFDLELEIPQWTKIQLKNEENFQGTLELPTRLSTKEIPELPTPYEKVFAWIVQGTDTAGKKVNVKFDQETILTLPTESKTPIDPANLKVLYFDEATKEYTLAERDGGELSSDGKSIKVKINYTGKFIVVNTKGIDFSEVSQFHFSAEGGTPLKDINDHWAKNYIIRLYDMKVVKGRTSDQFAPDANVTRAELIKIALVAFDYEIPETVTQNPFRDVEIQDWYAPFVQGAKDAGILQGYIDGTFRPNQAVNRAEALKILLEASKVNITKYPNNFADVDSQAWFANYVSYAQEKGIVAGYAIDTEQKNIGSLYSFKRYLWQGDQGEDVGSLQEALQKLGYGEVTITKVFDAKTADALIQYQLKKGLVALGNFWPQTKAIFEKEKITVQGETKKYLFKPDQPVTRAEIAKIALKTLDLKSLVQNENVTYNGKDSDVLQTTKAFFETVRKILI